jgi:hypothetical protein
LYYWNFDPEKKDAEEGNRPKGNKPAERVVKTERPGTGSYVDENPDNPFKTSKRMPVFFLDEAHKLPTLVPDEDVLKTLLDSMLYRLSIQWELMCIRVITKQDRLCHVVHATSDPFYMQWLGRMNISTIFQGVIFLHQATIRRH